MEDEILIGIDLQAKLQIGVPPPPKKIIRKILRCNAARGLAVQTAREKEELQQFLEKELKLFKEVHGATNKVEHDIRLRNTTPLKQRYRPRNPAMQAIINEEVGKMLADDIIEPSHSPWSSPIVLVKKKDGKHRFCIDFRKVNDAMHKDAYPLPQIPATLDKLRGARYLSTLDLKNGYWQVPLTPDSRPITAFTVPGMGLFQFKVMPFGLHSAPATFQRLLDKVLGPNLEPHVFVYLDDIIVISETFNEHLELLTETFRRLREARLKLNPDKCKFCVDQLRYLWDTLSIATCGTHCRPRGNKNRFGKRMASWYRHFIANFSTITAPLTALTRKNARWVWGPEQSKAFSTIKNRLNSAPVLTCPDFSQRFYLQTDASTSGLGAVLTQQYEEGERVVAYASRTLNIAEKNYSATELECLAVVWGIRRMKNYLEGYAFTRTRYHAPTVSTAKKANRCQWYDRIREETLREPGKRPEYKIKEGKLYRHILHSLDFKERSSDEQWKICIPTPVRKAVIHQYHDEPTAGHLGIAKTIARIAERHYWPGMFRDIAKYVRRCETCQSFKAAQQRPAGKLHAMEVKRPWEQVSIDLIGPLPRSKKGHTWLLVMQDRFSKWVELTSLRKATADAVTQAVTNNIILRHGRPEIILSDNGTQLRSKQLENRLKECNIRHVITSAYAPHCNPVERTNRTIKTMVAQFAGADQKTYGTRNCRPYLKVESILSSVPSLRLLTYPIAKFKSVPKIGNQGLVKSHSVWIPLVFMKSPPDRVTTNTRISFWYALVNREDAIELMQLS
ncbi:uncharacterized protein LOC112637817 [Camponotus floridanus]|uniref:uncharacterized protein LOC112637817 n=1 Tax=Camponotus floridanus TaxID=104421 RepID=UPI000DC6BED6|nr:uncharacterized protein LOC112637817 [Camponotus floridanus]